MGRLFLLSVAVLVLGCGGGSKDSGETGVLDTGDPIDADGDGSVVDDVANMVLGGSKKKGGLGGLLGGLFGK